MSPRQDRPHPAQPRTQFDPTTIKELATSIRERGVLQPVLVRPSGGAFQIVAGERRFLHPRSGLETIPGNSSGSSPIARPLLIRSSKTSAGD